MFCLQLKRSSGHNLMLNLNYKEIYIFSTLKKIRLFLQAAAQSCSVKKVFIKSLSTLLKERLGPLVYLGGAWGADAPSSECLVSFFRVLSALFCPIFHLKIITLLKVFYNFTKFLHNHNFNTSRLQPVNLILGDFACFFTFSFL